MNPKDRIRNRPSIENSKENITDFFANIKNMTISLHNQQSDFPLTDGVDYFYINGEHIAIIPPMSALYGKLHENTKLTGYYQEGFGKFAKKLYSHFDCSLIDCDYPLVLQLTKTNPVIGKMISHKATFIKLNITNATLLLNPMEMYNIDNDLNPSFAKFAPNGKERFENSRHVLMTYLDREVIFSVIVEDDTYYCLAKENSNKMSHIKNGGTCKIYDGKDNHFETVIQIVDDKKEEIFNKLKNTNNSYFKENKELVALSFKNTREKV